MHLLCLFIYKIWCVTARHILYYSNMRFSSKLNFSIWRTWIVFINSLCSIYKGYRYRIITITLNIEWNIAIYIIWRCLFITEEIYKFLAILKLWPDWVFTKLTVCILLSTIVCASIFTVSVLEIAVQFLHFWFCYYILTNR